MKRALSLCWLVLVLGCAGQGVRVETEQSSGQIGTDQLMDAFITYVQKAEGAIGDKERNEEMRTELLKVRDDPLLSPYIFAGDRCDREAIVDEIARAKAKWLSSDVPPSQVARYAFETSNLETLTDAELVIALRLVDQVVSHIERRR
jgi:hypothetical protein